MTTLSTILAVGGAALFIAVLIAFAALAGYWLGRRDEHRAHADGRDMTAVLPAQPPAAPRHPVRVRHDDTQKLPTVRGGRHR